MKIKRIICSVATVAVFALLATSCGSKGETTKKPTDKTTIKIVTTSKQTTKKDTTKRVTTQHQTTEESEQSKLKRGFDLKWNVDAQ